MKAGEQEDLEEDGTDGQRQMRGWWMRQVEEMWRCEKKREMILCEEQKNDMRKVEREAGGDKQTGWKKAWYCLGKSEAVKSLMVIGGDSTPAPANKLNVITLQIC